jgi:hypothetical protein
MKNTYIYLLAALILVPTALYFTMDADGDWDGTMTKAKVCSIMEYETCRNMKCFEIQCADGDAACDKASKAYTEKFQANKYCQKWTSYFTT